MPELVTCPACGYGVQAIFLTAGARTRCPACGNVFTLEAGRTQSPGAPEALVYRLRDVPVTEEVKGRRPRPLCPGCHRPVGSHDDCCLHCGYLFAAGSVRAGPRRDSLPHRGGLVHLLGIVSLYSGAVSLVAGPLGLLASLATGIPAAVMAAHDLPLLRAGEMDPAGSGDTQAGKNKAVVGMALGVALGVPVTLWLARRWM